MNQAEIDRAVRRVRDCTHDRWHYQDENGNRRCVQCEAFVRPVVGAQLLVRETRTLTNGWVMPSWQMMRNLENRARADLGLPELTDEPEIRNQQRWVTEWEDRT